MTPAAMNPAGTGRYAHALSEALETLPDTEVRRVRQLVAPTRRPGAGAITTAVREGYWYPVGVGLHGRRLKADVAHVPAALGPPLPWLPTVMTIHDVLPLRQPELFVRGMVLHQKRVLPWLVRRAARVIAVSEYTRGEVIELLGVAPERVVTVHNGVDWRFSPMEVDDAWLAQKFGLTRPYVLSTGTLEPRKNLRTVVEALPRFPDGVTLAVAGGRGWHAHAIEEALERAGGRAVRLGFVSDAELARLYAGAACFVFPSLSEGFGLPPLEAMASGTPVVCGNRTSLPEVVGDAAVMVEPESAVAIADAVSRIVEDDDHADDLRRRGLARAAEFSWERAAERTRAVYERALGGG